MAATTPVLILLPSLRACRHEDGRYYLTQKFIDGVYQFQRYWPGKVTVLIETRPEPDGNLDSAPLDEIAEIDIRLCSYANLKEELDSLPRPAIALSSTVHEQNQVTAICRERGVLCVPTTEYTLQTRYQIIKAERKSLLRRVYGYGWEYMQEKKNIASVAGADSIQCNGTPTYNAYKNFHEAPLLFFDNRIAEKDLASYQTIETRLSQCKENAPLRLIYSGRLDRMKGVHHLPPIAEFLRSEEVPFQLAIYGDGVLKEWLEQEIVNKNLSGHVRLAGVLEFHDGLVPEVSRNADLFLCCHLQGDPSCTYIETMSCGVPIVGYDNEAFKGMHDLCGAGWLIAMSNAEQMGKQIKHLHLNREEIAEHAVKSREFAEKFTFEKTFKQRMDHLRSIVDKHVENPA